MELNKDLVRMTLAAALCATFGGAALAGPNTATQLFGEGRDLLNSDQTHKVTVQFDRPMLREVGEGTKVRLQIAPPPMNKAVELNYIRNAMGVTIAGPPFAKVNMNGFGEFTIKCTELKNAGTCQIFVTILKPNGSFNHQYAADPKMVLKPHDGVKIGNQPKPVASPSTGLGKIAPTISH